MAKKEPDKMCLRCRGIKPISEFYKNRGWSAQSFADTICKECAKETVFDKDTARKYCWENNRVWSEAAWTAAMKKADMILANNAEYLNAKTSQKRKTEIENRCTSNQFFSVMNTNAFYCFVENETDEGRLPFNPDSLAGTTQETEMTREDDEQVYSDEWHGMFSRRE